MKDGDPFFRIALELEPNMSHQSVGCAWIQKSMRARKVTNTDHQTDYTEDRVHNQNGELCN